MSRLVVIFVFALFPLVSTFADSAKTGFAARVVSVEGSTLIRKDSDDPNQAANSKPLKVGDQVFPGQVINTGSTAKVKLLFSDKSIIDIGPSSLFKVSDYKANSGSGDRQVDVEMKYGSVRAAISEKIKNGGHFRVKTPTATMGVRGTEFLIKADQATTPANTTAPVEATRTQMIVVQGSVESQGVSGTQAPVLVSPGQSLVSGAGDVQMKNVDMNDTKVKQEVASYKVQPATFSQAIGVSNNGDSKGSSMGESTLAVVKDAVKQTGPANVPLSASGFLLNQNPANWIQQDRNLTQGIPVPVTVNVVGF